MVSPGICEIKRKTHPVKGLQWLVTWGEAMRELEGKERETGKQAGVVSYRHGAQVELCRVCRAATELQMMLLSAQC